MPDPRPTNPSPWSYQARIEALRRRKLDETAEKQRVLGAMNYDDWSLILPAEAEREIVQVMSPSGVPIADCRLKTFHPEPNHPSGGFYGPEAVGRNFRRLLDVHPICLDANSALAGGYCVNFSSYRSPHWNPDISFSHLAAEQELYALGHGIGAMQHFCQDLAIGLHDGWQTILNRVRYYRGEHPAERQGFFDGLEHVVLGMQGWINRHAEAASTAATRETLPERRRNLEEIAEMNLRLVASPPATFREALQWMLWYQLAARMYNVSGSLGRIDVLLQPFYELDRSAGRLDDDEAVFYLACFLVRDTGYSQLGGPDEGGRDVTNKVSYLVLEAAHLLRVPANVGVCVGQGTDPGLLRRGVEIMLSDGTGIPKFLGVDNTSRGFTRNGYSLELARTRAYSGCHWSGLPGREYTMNDCVKLNFAKVFEVAFRELMDDGSATQSVTELWARFVRHLRRATDAIARGLAFHLEHMHEVFPELVLDLLCHGPVERGLDASHGGVEYTNLCIDGVALATVADSFAAILQRVEEERKLTFRELDSFLKNDWAGPDGERVRALMRASARFGSGGSPGDQYAARISRVFSEAVKAAPSPPGVTLIPGIFSWAAMIDMGLAVGATPNGRRARAPISHGANPDPGFRKDASPTALAAAVAAVQSGYGNTAPLQIELDPALARAASGPRFVEDLIRTHFDLGGTQINMNVIAKEKLLAAHRDPAGFPELVVRVTGFSAYFASLSPEFREMIIARTLE